ncbi:hypothetical protein ACEPPN_018895 [Leptodophora sp. 'Broadleaf-Isolate-01']
MDIFQTVVASLELIYAYGKPFLNHAKDAEGLYMRLQWDLKVLKGIQESVGRLKEGQAALPADEKLIWESSLEYLGRLSRRLLPLQQNIQNSQTQLKFAFCEQDYRELCRELFEWTQRFDVRLMGLPPAMRAQFQLDFNSPQAIRATPYMATQERIESFYRHGEMARATSADKLLISEPEKAFGISTPPPRHCFVKFSGKDAIVEYKNIPRSVLAPGNNGGLRTFKNLVAEICAILNLCESSSTGVPKSLGYFWNLQNLQFGLVYEVPYKIPSHETEPLTLSSMLREPPKVPPRPDERAAKPQHPLNQRFEFAKKLATALLFLHTTGWLHKDIRPENILVFQSSSVPHAKRFPRVLGDPFLVGLESARATAADSDKSARRKEAMWKMDIYQHPDRVYINAPIERDYTKAHDVYSLGIVLLEIGLWKPLSTLEDVKKLYNRHGNPPIGGHGPGQELRRAREELLLMLARTTEVCMGDMYASVVENCLKVNLNADYIRDVLEQLEQLSTAMNGGS